VVALDTGCLWGGALTAFRLEDGALFQVACEARRNPG
jgi:bis(5'-nucleosyl)-tetraphosphatase (symmetrical)